MPFACPTVYDEILKWSKSRPPWQRDALRRLVVNGSLRPGDIDDIFLLCKIAHGLEDASKYKVAATPLDESHLCHDAQLGNPVMLTGISDVSNVNAIASDNPCSFNESGITVIYGDNGAGKSGYVRILKSVCRAREVGQKILPNVFAADEGKVSSANISFKAGDTSCTFPWEKDKEGPADLSCVNVFDSGCASVYVNEDNRIVYMPLGLDVFDKLAKACDAIKVKLVAEKEKIVSTLDKLPQEYDNTAIGKWYAGIKRSTPGDEVFKNTSFSADDGKRAAELQKALLEDNKKKRANELRTKKERYDLLLQRIKAISVSLSDDSVEKLKNAKSALDTASKMALLASKAAFEKKEQLKCIGSDPWRELWMAAKKFSETEAYPGKEFPNTEPGSKCVLCLQDLGPEAIERMESFRKFIQDEAASKESKARQEYDEEKTTFEDIGISEHGDETLLKEVKEDDDILGKSLSSYLKTAKNRKAAALKACEDGAWEEIASLAEITPAEQLKNLCTELESRAKTLEEAEDPEVLPRLQAELSELSARKWVSERRKGITAEITRLYLVSLYDSAIHH